MLTFSKIEDFWFDGYTTGWLGYPDGVNQNDYLQFAESDLKDGQSNRHLINAVSSAKRALHMEVETLSDAYGFGSAGKKFSSFFHRLEFLSRASFFAQPRLLTKLNKLRNVVEHEYYVPTVEEAENFIDVVSLFVNAMQKHRQRYPDLVEMHEAFDDSKNFRISRISFNFKGGELIFQISPTGQRHSPQKINCKSISISNERDEYIRWLSYVIRNNT